MSSATAAVDVSPAIIRRRPLNSAAATQADARQPPYASSPSSTSSPPSFALNDKSLSTKPLPSLPVVAVTRLNSVPKRKLVPVRDRDRSTTAGSIDSEPQLQEINVSPVEINPPQPGLPEPDAASIREASIASNPHPYFHDHAVVMNVPTRSMTAPEEARLANSIASMSLAQHSQNNDHAHDSYHSPLRDARSSNNLLHDREDEFNYESEPHEGLQYHAFEGTTPRVSSVPKRVSHLPSQSLGSSSSGGNGEVRSSSLHVPRNRLSRPTSAYTLSADPHQQQQQQQRGRTLSPYDHEDSQSSSSRNRSRDVSARRSPMGRPTSYVDLLQNMPYSQQVAPAPTNNQFLQSVVGNAASLLNTKKTLEMYRANVKKAADPAVQYEFAVFMANVARDSVPGDGIDSAELLLESKHILQRLSDRTYPFAQYYLADGYSSGFFNKGKPDHDKAFPLFVSASKHGHAEAGYRAALCYEFGWGTAKSYPKAAQFYRTSASKNHPGAATRLGLACINGDMGLEGRERQREGIKWLKRAQESADGQYNAGPYELALLHITGFGDVIFRDEAYAAQLFTQSADLGHPEANFRLGQAYENGICGCPRDAALSVHFYNGAASRGHAEAMLALCAWYMLGAEPVLEKDENEAFAWALQAAEAGLPKAEYAVGYFTEMGIGCRRDPLEANMWYVRAAEKGNETAQQRLEIIRAASAGAPTTSRPGVPMSKAEAKSADLRAVSSGVAGAERDAGGKKRILGIF